MRRRWAMVGTIVAAALGAGCGGRAHLREGYGERVNAAFAAQRVKPPAAATAPSGLDSEEAAIIYGRYRTSVGATKDRSKDAGGRVLMIEEPRDGAKR